MENKEMNLNELEVVTGGKGGSKTELHATKYYDVYRIQPGENLTRIARNFNTTVSELVRINKTITDKNDITAGYYIYVPKQK